MAREARTDHDLMISIARGDALAFRILVDRHQAAIHRIGWRMLGGAEAEDVTQETFLRLWTKAPTWAPTGSVFGWLRQIVTNLCLDRLRSRRFWSDTPVPVLPDDSERGEAVVYVDQRRRLVSRCLDRLSGRQRAAIVLTYYEELPNAEAAVTLGLTVKAFESLLLRARQKLAAALSAEGLISSGGLQ